MSTTRKTDPQLAAAIKAIFEMQKRVRELEVMCEGLLAQGRGHSAALDRLEAMARQNRELAAHVLRLLRQKECLMEMVGRFVLEQQNPMFKITAPQGLDAESLANIKRALKEMGEPH